MKTNVLKTLLSGALLLVGVSVSAQNQISSASVTGYDQNSNEATVSGALFDDWSVELTLPDASTAIGLDKATVHVESVDLPSVSLKAQNKTITRSTGVDGVYVEPKTYLPNVYDFQGVTVPVTVLDGTTNEVKKFTYEISACSSNKITGKFLTVLTM